LPCLLSSFISITTYNTAVLAYEVLRTKFALTECRYKKNSNACDANTFSYCAFCQGFHSRLIARLYPNVTMLPSGLCYRKSVCLSSATFVHPAQGFKAFGNISSLLVPWPSCDFLAKFYGDRSRGTPPAGQWRREGFAAPGKRLCCRPRQSDQLCNQGIFQNFGHGV